jgi:hypothetical protein
METSDGVINEAEAAIARESIRASPVWGRTASACGRERRKRTTRDGRARECARVPRPMETRARGVRTPRAHPPRGCPRWRWDRPTGFSSSTPFDAQRDLLARATRPGASPGIGDRRLHASFPALVVAYESSAAEDCGRGPGVFMRRRTNVASFASKISSAGWSSVFRASIPETACAGPPVLGSV